MARYSSLKFERKLDELFYDRTDWLRRQVTKAGMGRPPTFTKKKTERAITSLQNLATEYLIKQPSIKNLDKYYTAAKSWHVTNRKGHGYAKKQKNFKRWYDEEIGHTNCVYVFMSGRKKCVYVGSTKRGGKRPQKHFDKIWFRKVTRIDIYSCKGARNISKIECLATHLLNPSDSKIKPAKRRMHTHCPICKVHQDIREEVGAIFRLKK